MCVLKTTTNIDFITSTQPMGRDVITANTTIINMLAVVSRSNLKIVATHTHTRTHMVADENPETCARRWIVFECLNGKSSFVASHTFACTCIHSIIAIASFIVRWSRAHIHTHKHAHGVTNTCVICRMCAVAIRPSMSEMEPEHCILAGRVLFRIQIQPFTSCLSPLETDAVSYAAGASRSGARSYTASRWFVNVCAVVCICLIYKLAEFRPALMNATGGLLLRSVLRNTRLA